MANIQDSSCHSMFMNFKKDAPPEKSNDKELPCPTSWCGPEPRSWVWCAEQDLGSIFHWPSLVKATCEGQDLCKWWLSRDLSQTLTDWLVWWWYYLEVLESCRDKSYRYHGIVFSWMKNIKTFFKVSLKWMKDILQSIT